MIWKLFESAIENLKTNNREQAWKFLNEAKKKLPPSSDQDYDNIIVIMAYIEDYLNDLPSMDLKRILEEFDLGLKQRGGPSYMESYTKAKK
jgi:hypothetical protein